MEPGQTWQPGQLLGEHLQVYAMKQGSMGAVYFCKFLGGVILPCAIKVLPARLLLEHRELFFREMSTWIALGSHPNVVRALLAEEIEEKPCLVLEYIAGDVRHGSDLGGWIGTPELDLRRSLLFASQICAAMMHASEKFSAEGKRFAHLDIKPSNLLIASPNQLKVSDFGVAQVYDAETGAPRAELERVNGAYMAPEQHRGDRADVRSDVYAFGCVLFEMLTAATVFDLPRDSVENRDAHLRAVPRRPAELNPALPAALDRVVTRCLQKDPAARYPDFAGVQSEIQRIFAVVFGAPLPPTPPARVDENLERITQAMSMLVLGRAATTAKVLEDLDGTMADESAALVEARAKALAAIGRADEALDLLDRALQRRPSHAGLWNHRGTLLTAAARHQEALQSFERARKLNPHDPLVLNNEGYLLIELGRPEEAIAALEQSVLLNPRLAAAWNNQGRAHAALEQWSQARECYKRSTDINPAEAEVWYNASVAEIELGDPERSAEFLRKALLVDPLHWQSLHNLAVLLLAGNATERDRLAAEEAISAQKAFVRAHPGERVLLNELAATLSALGRSGEARELVGLR